MAADLGPHGGRGHTWVEGDTSRVGGGGMHTTKVENSPKGRVDAPRVIGDDPRMEGDTP